MTRSKAEEAYYAIRSRIAAGALQQGSGVLEENMAAELGMSRTPLRAALARLEAEGFLVQGDDRTLRVPFVTKESLKYLLEARLMLEVSVAMAVCERASHEHMTRLGHLIWDQKEAYRSCDTIHVAVADRRFHTYMAESSGNPHFAEFSERLNYKVSFALAATDTLCEEVPIAIEEHERILDALISRDRDRCSHAVTAHLEEAMGRMLLRLDKMGRKD